MSLELIKESVKINRVIGDQAAQTIVENDIIVPDTKPDIARILLLDGDSYVNGADVTNDKILVNGNIRYKILYVSDEEQQQVRSIITNAGFSYSMDVSGAEQGMNCRAKCDIEHIDYEILNGRKVNIKTILNINGKVTEEIDQQIICDISGVEDAQVLRSDLKVVGYLGSSQTSAVLKETVEIPAGKPAVREILRNDLKISGKELRATDDKVMTKGNVNVSTLYIGDDAAGGIQYMEHEFPFTYSLDIPGVNEEAECIPEYRITDAQFDIDEDSDGEYRYLKAEIALDLWVEAFGRNEMKVIADAYSPRSRLDIEKVPLKMEDFISENMGQIVLKDMITIDDESPDISEVYNVLCKPVLSEYRIVDNKLALEGVIGSKLLYLANSAEQPLYCYEQEFPFKHGMDIEGLKQAMSPEIELEIENISYSMISAKEVEVRLTVAVHTRIYRQSEVNLIDKIVESPLEEQRLAGRASIVIYFAQAGDTLWKIAKKYYTTMDDILKVNSLSGTEPVKQGQQIIIPRKI